MVELLLTLYLLITYAAGVAFMIMTLSKDRELIVGDIIMLVLSPLTMVPIFTVQFVSMFIDVDTVVYKL